MRFVDFCRELCFPHPKTKTFRILDRGTGKWNIQSASKRRCSFCNFFFLLHFARKWRSLFHYLIDASLPVFLIALASYYFLMNIIFGAFYRAAGTSAITNIGSGYWDYFFFSIQTMETVGYGFWAPTDGRANAVMTIQLFFALLATAYVTAIVVARISRPSSLKRHILWSDVAVINDTSFDPKTNVPDKDSEMVFEKERVQTLTFRLCNPNQTQLLSSTLKMYVFKQKSNDDNETENFFIEDIGFELYRQNKLPGDYHQPLVGLPWVVTHYITPNSPLYGMTAEKLAEQKVEIIAVFDGVSEAVGLNVQSRWSYIASEIVFNGRFAPMLRAVGTRMEVDYFQLSKINIVA